MVHLAHACALSDRLGSERRSHAQHAAKYSSFSGVRLETHRQRSLLHVGGGAWTGVLGERDRNERTYGAQKSGLRDFAKDTLVRQRLCDNSKRALCLRNTLAKLDRTHCILLEVKRVGLRASSTSSSSICSVITLRTAPSKSAIDPMPQAGRGSECRHKGRWRNSSSRNLERAGLFIPCY